MTLDENGAVKSASYYHAFGKHDDKIGDIETDKHRANTKVEDEDGLLNEGKRFRSLEYAIFITPDPLEYVDGLNMYIYCGNNPWGRFDPLGLAMWGEMVHEGVGMYDNTIKGAKSQSPAFSTNINFKVDNLKPGETYHLAVKLNFKATQDGKSVERESDYVIFKAVADKNGVATFYKAGNVVMDEGNPNTADIKFEKGKKTDISLDYTLKLIEPGMITKYTEDESNKDNPVSIADYDSKTGKYRGEAKGQKPYGILSALYAHSKHHPFTTDVEMEGNEIKDSETASLKVSHVGGEEEADYTSKNISGSPSSGNEKRSNVKFNEKKPEKPEASK